jgi:hypothetical protein
VGVARDEQPPVSGGRSAWIAAQASSNAVPIPCDLWGTHAPRGGDCDKADGQVVVMRGWPAWRKSGIEMLCEPLRHRRRNESGLDRGGWPGTPLVAAIDAFSPAR